LALLRNIYPLGFDSYTFKPSVGASRGILVAWKGALFSSTQIFQNDFVVSMEMTSIFNNNSWILTSVYAPYTPAGKRSFLEWFKHIQMPEQTEWIIVGDFNLIRKPKDRNKGDVNEMFLFNKAINP
jgi:hypothetical protein